MSAIEPNISGLAVFAAAWSLCCLSGFLLAELLPLSSAPDRLQTSGGRMLTIVGTLLFALLVALTLAYSFQELRWTSIVVAGGVIFLFAPFVIQDIPEGRKHNQGVLAVLIALLFAAVAALLMRVAPQGVSSII